MVLMISHSQRLTSVGVLHQSIKIIFPRHFPARRTVPTDAIISEFPSNFLLVGVKT
jgi:hypothetical protein